MQDSPLLYIVITLAFAIIVSLVITHFYAKYRTRGLLYSAAGTVLTIVGFLLIVYSNNDNQFLLFLANSSIVCGLLLFTYSTYRFIEQKFPWLDISIFSTVLIVLLLLFHFGNENKMARQIIVSVSLLYIATRISFVLIHAKHKSAVARHTYQFIFFLIALVQLIRIVLVLSGEDVLYFMIPGLNLNVNDLVLLLSGLAIVLLALAHVVVINYLTIKELNAERAALEELSNLDYLTKIPNRRNLNEHVDILIARSTPFALLMTDMDEFKLINDTYGHTTGDAVLLAFATQIMETKPDNVYIARFGGDEFVYVITDYISIEHLRDEIKAKLHDKSVEVHINNKTFGIKSSIGISLFPEDANDYEELILHADLALYNVKKTTKNETLFYHELTTQEKKQKN